MENKKRFCLGLHCPWMCENESHIQGQLPISVAVGIFMPIAPILVFAAKWLTLNKSSLSQCEEKVTIARDTVSKNKQLLRNILIFSPLTILLCTLFFAPFEWAFMSLLFLLPYFVGSFLGLLWYSYYLISQKLGFN